MAAPSCLCLCVVVQVNSLAIPRVAKQAIGAITKYVHHDPHCLDPLPLSAPFPPPCMYVVLCRLSHKDGRVQIVNVEYNQLDPLLRAEVNPEGDVPDASGFSPYPGMPSLCTYTGVGRSSLWPAPWYTWAVLSPSVAVAVG